MYFHVCRPANMELKCSFACRYRRASEAKIVFGVNEINLSVKRIYHPHGFGHVAHNGGNNSFSDADCARFLLLWRELQSSENHIIRSTSVLTDSDNFDAHDLRNIHSAKNTHLTLVRVSERKRGRFPQRLSYVGVGGLFFVGWGSGGRSFPYYSLSVYFLFEIETVCYLQTCFVWLD